MTEHVCEFKPMLCECECGNTLTIAEICKRANATERLSAENARWIAEDYVLAYPEHLGYARSKQTDALKAYADILEGKDDLEPPRYSKRI